MKSKYDYLIVGAGAGGCPVASRLSENSDYQVAILEAGGENTNDISRIPGAFARVWGTDYTWKHQTTKQDGLCGRAIDQVRGHVVGGSTAINGGFWLRGSKADYDSWGSLTSSSWNFDMVCDLFKRKIEDSDRGPNEYRGKGGMMRLEDLPSPSILPEKLEQGFKEAGFGIIADTNGADPCSAYRIETIFENHSRLTVADNYLSEKIRERNNLDVLANTFVRKLIFEGKRVVGVEVEHEGVIQSIEVTKEVILSAGAFNTPQILKLSGLGPKDELEKLGIELIADIPGVGENLGDHLMTSINILSPVGVNESVPMDSSDEAIAQWRKDKTGPAIYWSTNTTGFFAFEDTFDPDIELLMDYNPAFIGSDPTADLNVDENRGGYTISIVLLKPKSKGRVTLRSDNPKDLPVIDPCYLSDKDDVDKLIQAFRRVFPMVKSTALEPYTDIVNPALDSSNSDLEDHIRNTVFPIFHASGTAKMGSDDDPMAVVDSRLCVRGIEGLRIADASIMPSVIRGHHMAPIIMIGEYLAEVMIHSAQTDQDWEKLFQLKKEKISV